jgi:hypothetical protein
MLTDIASIPECIRRKFDNDKSTAFFKSIGERISIKKLEELRKNEENK